jgi:hypothetical protein
VVALEVPVGSVDARAHAGRPALARRLRGVADLMPAVPLRRNRDFVLLQGGQLLSSAGSESTAIAYPLPCWR